MIAYIQTDEKVHISIFQNIIPIAMSLFPHSVEQIYEITNKAVEQETLWNNHIIGDGILGLSPQANENYIKYLADLRLKAIGLEPLYGVKKNPYKHLELADDTQGDSKGNFFESTITAYNVHTSISGWDDF